MANPIDMLQLEQALRAAAGWQGGPMGQEIAKLQAAVNATTAPDPSIQKPQIDPSPVDTAAPKSPDQPDFSTVLKEAVSNPFQKAGWTDTSEVGVYKKKEAGKSTQYTNAMDSSGTPSMTSTTAPVKPSDAALNTNIKSIVARIRSATDEGERLQYVSDLKIAGQKELVTIEADLRSSLEQRYNIPMAREVLRGAEMVDARNGVGSSPASIAARKTLIEQMQLVEQELPKALKTNFRINAVQSALSTASEISKNVTDLNATQAKQNILAETKKAVRVEDVLVSTSEASRARMRVLDPSMKDKTDEEIAQYLAHNIHKLPPDVKEVLNPTLNKDEITNEAFRGNATALKIMAADEVLSGKSPFKTPEEIVKYVAGAEDEINRSGGYVKLAERVFKGQEEKISQFRSLKNVELQKQLGKDQKAMYDNDKAVLLRSFLGEKATRQYTADVRSWKTEDQVLAKIIGDSATGATDLFTVAKQYAQTVPREKRADAFEQMKRTMYANRIESALKPVDYLGIEKKLIEEMGKGRLAEVTSTFDEVYMKEAERLRQASPLHKAWDWLSSPSIK